MTKICIKLSETIHYLEVLKGDYSIMQPELRRAIDHALSILNQLHNTKDLIKTITELTVVD